MKTQGRFLWQNWPPGWVVSRSGVTSVGGGYIYIYPNLVSEFFGWNFFQLASWKFLRGGLGYFYVCPNLESEFFGQNFFSASQKFQRGVTFTFVQIWCWNFLAKIFFGQLKISVRGVLLHLSKSGVGIFWPKFFFSWPKILEGEYFYISPKMTSEFFPNQWGVPKYENFRMSWNIQICKNFWPRSILCWPFWAPKFWLSQLWLTLWPSYTYCPGPRFLLKLHILS